MKLISVNDKRVYDIYEKPWHDASGGLLDLQFEAKFDVQKISRSVPDLWRYKDAIPLIDNKKKVSFCEGFTPLIPVRFDQKELLIKQEQLFATGSYKDRGATVLLSYIHALGIKHIVQDSSGNAGCSVAAYAAAAQVTCDIYVPASASPAKLVQIELYGANIRKIPGSREDTAAAAFKAAQQTYYASHCWNPFFFHGTKTFAYEVCEQLGWQSPDSVVLPAGNGTLVMGCLIGFTDLIKAGIIDTMPKLIAVQAENCAPLYQAFQKRVTTIPVVETKETLAEGIAITTPVRAKQILDGVRESNGEIITVSETEIKETLFSCLKKGYYIEPTSAAAVAGALKYIEAYPHERVVTLFSGHGLKSTEKLMCFL